MNPARLRLAALVLVGATFALLFGPVLLRLAEDWKNDDNYSHGFLIIPLAAYFVWERRARLAALAPAPPWLGLVAVIGGLAVLLAGLLGAELFLTRSAMLIVAAG